MIDNLMYQWWWIPTALTIAAILWLLFPSGKREHGFMAGIKALILFGPLSVLVCVAWVVAEVLR